MISLMDQYYVPEGYVINDPLLNRRLSKAEVEKTRELVKKYSLREVKDSHGKFWQEG